MRTTTILTFLLLALCFLPRLSQAAVDPGASEVQLLTSCQVNGSTLDNCFTDLNTLNSWMWNTRSTAPSASSPLLVKIGPGTFTGQFTCSNAGYVSLQGSGIGVSVITNGYLPITTDHCEDMSYSSLTVKNTDNILGVRENGGTSVWNNAEIDAVGYAWFDGAGSGCNGATPGNHYFYGGKIVANTIYGSATVWYDQCDKSWFFGSQLQAVGDSGAVVRIIDANGGEVHVYGGNIEALTNGNVSVTSMDGVTSTDSGIVHLHGTGIDVISDGQNDITALNASKGGLIHAVADGYFLQSTGTITRIANSGGTVMAPYHWPASATPPGVISVTGSDTAVATSTSDGHPHPLVYDSTCTNKWYDTITRACW